MPNRKETIEQLCQIVTVVGREKFKNTLEYDCFCSVGAKGKDAYVHPEILAFITLAVMDRLKEEK